MFVPHAKGNLRQCASGELEGQEAQLELNRIVSPPPEEVIGPEPSQRTYAFAGQRDYSDTYGRPLCTALDDLRDLRVDIEQVDGVLAAVMRRIEQRAFSALATPGAVTGTPAATASVAATAVENRTESTSPIVAGATSTSISPSAMTESGQQAAEAARGRAEANGVPLAVAGTTVAVLMAAGLFGVRRLRSRRPPPRQRHAHRSNSDPGVVAPIVRAGTSLPSDQDRHSSVEANNERGATSPVSDRPLDVDASAQELPVQPVLPHAPDKAERTMPTVITSDAAPIEVICFGGPRVVYGDRVLWPSREFGQEGKSVELLLLLAASAPEGVDRDAIGAALWPDIDLADVGASLRQLRRRLRLIVTRVVPGLPESAPFQTDSGRVYRLDPQVAK
jgi:hypothetical protein